MACTGFNKPFVYVFGVMNILPFLFKSVLRIRIRIRLDQFRFGQPDPDPGSIKPAKNMENFHKNSAKS